MLYRIAVALLLTLAVPMADASAQTKGKGAKDCDAIARSQCPSYGQGGVACYRSAFARCKKGG
jgi:hypothetical protein